MAALTGPAARYLAQSRDFERNGASVDPSWLRDARRAALADFERLGFPVERRGNEAWKYTNPRPIAEGAFALGDGAPGARVDLAAYELPCPRVHQVAFVDGRYEPALSTEPPSEAALRSPVLGHAGDGPIVGRLADAVEYRVPGVRERLARLAPTSGSGFTALNTAFLHDGAYVQIPDGVAAREPIHLLFITTGARPIATHPRVLVLAGADSSATVVVSHEGAGAGAYFTNAVVEIAAGPRSELRLYTLQRESEDAYHVSATHVEQAQDSRVTSVCVDLGARLARRDVNVALAAGGASVGLYGLYHADGERHVDNHTFVDHAVPDASSREVYKGLLAGESRGVFCGRVLVRPGAQGTESRQVNKNLLLSPGAEVDTQPMLEIFADDVVCTHGAAVGQLDAEALFYLKSRGIGESAARRLLARGFVSEVVDAIADDAVRQYVDAAIAGRLSWSA